MAGTQLKIVSKQLVIRNKHKKEKVEKVYRVQMKACFYLLILFCFGLNRNQLG
jgi:hypothetical protein